MSGDAKTSFPIEAKTRKSENRAIRQFRKVLARETNYVAAMASLVEAEFRNNNRKEAEKVMEDLKKADAVEAKKLEFLFTSTAILQYVYNQFT